VGDRDSVASVRHDAEARRVEGAVSPRLRANTAIVVSVAPEFELASAWFVRRVRLERIGTAQRAGDATT